VAAHGAEPLAWVQPFVEHVRDHQRVFRALAGKSAVHAVEKRLLQVISEFLEPAFAQVRPGARCNAAVRFTAGGFRELLIGWLEKRNGLDEVAIATLLRQLTSAAVSQAKRSE
jgi:hypothetical protein